MFTEKLFDHMAGDARIKLTILTINHSFVYSLIQLVKAMMLTSGGDTQRAEQERTTQSAGNKHGAQQ